MLTRSSTARIARRPCRPTPRGCGCDTKYACTYHPPNHAPTMQWPMPQPSLLLVFCLPLRFRKGWCYCCAPVTSTAVYITSTKAPKERSPPNTIPPHPRRHSEAHCPPPTPTLPSPPPPDSTPPPSYTACTNAYDYGDPTCLGNSSLYWGTGNKSDLSCAHCVCDEGWAGVDCGRCLDVSVCPSTTVGGKVRVGTRRGSGGQREGRRRRCNICIMRGRSP